MGQRSRAPPGGSGGAELPEHGSLFIVIIITFFGPVYAARGGEWAGMGGFKGCLYLVDVLYYCTGGFRVLHYIRVKAAIAEKRCLNPLAPLACAC